MGEITKIAWCDHTFNGWVGCEKISPACKHCYAEISTPARVSKSRGLPLWGPGSARHITSDSNWREPLKWNRAAERAGVIRRVFAHSLSDVFEDRRDLDPVRDRLWNLIGETPYLEWLLLTKRTDRVLDLVPWRWRASCFPWNVRIGTTVENQEDANRRIPHLLRIPSANFLSMEPLLGEVDLEDIVEPIGNGSEWHFNALESDVGEEDDEPFHGRVVNWVIVGGESGPEARPFGLPWARSLRQQCDRAGTPFFMKQLGAAPMDWEPISGGQEIAARFLTRHPKGEDMAEFPRELRCQEFPTRRAA